MQVLQFMRTDANDLIVRLDDMPPQAGTQLKSNLRQAARGRGGRRDMLTVLPSTEAAASTTNV